MRYAFLLLLLFYFVPSKIGKKKQDDFEGLLLFILHHSIVSAFQVILWQKILENKNRCMKHLSCFLKLDIFSCRQLQWSVIPGKNIFSSYSLKLSGLIDRLERVLQRTAEALERYTINDSLFRAQLTLLYVFKLIPLFW